MEVWKQLKKDIKISNVPEIWDQIVLMMENMACSNSIWNVVNRLIIAATIYYIWKERNDRIFAQDSKSAEVWWFSTLRNN
ncbi:RNA-directed DNA polymerase, eukaryota, Reverse transcriptase zinc-binding domain protein [Artemisia annua]|uniref:RNA-directed DNA polymerase, eukaryota, Reverse transcriptase zinc-binding domain protein n=1 Tax=Artemisia annua TaxID=35608 RepID=A0A2U1QA85_ARTAN|nr:RNA-directed DNA polymerase, eukaryota, Reverse transcriptase zinc-binding domain protein [Artemisia annua]